MYTTKNRKKTKPVYLQITYTVFAYILLQVWVYFVRLYLYKSGYVYWDNILNRLCTRIPECGTARGFHSRG